MYRLACHEHSSDRQYHLATIPLLTGPEIQEQIKRAHSAQLGWKQTTFAQRKLVLSSLRAWVLRDMDAICRVACRDTGKTREFTPLIMLQG
jgi:acyl-CoA reductase-like NAD-dependent aldehyde dehydrogenase